MRKILTILLLSHSTLIFAQAPSDGLIAYYPFNGNANDLSFNENHGVINGAVPDTGHTGILNSSYNFENGYIELNNSIIFPDSFLTLTCWVKVNKEEESSINMIYALDEEANFDSSEFDFYVESALYRYLYDYFWSHFANTKIHTKNQGTHQGEDYYFNQWGALIDNEYGIPDWVFVVIEITPDSITYNTNYSDDNEQDLTYSKIMGGVQYNSGRIGENFNGSIDELRIYDRKLSQSELSAIEEGISVQVNQITNDNTAIFPNPTSQMLNIETNNLKNGIIKVFNSQLQEVYSKSALNQTHTIDVSNWSPGIYSLQVVNNSTLIRNQKVIITK